MGIRDLLVPILGPRKEAWYQRELNILLAERERVVKYATDPIYSEAFRQKRMGELRGLNERITLWQLKMRCLDYTPRGITAFDTMTDTNDPAVFLQIYRGK